MTIRVSKNRIALEGIPINEAKGSNIASATTTSIGAATGNYVHITGTTTITGFGTAAQAGVTRTLVFDGILTLTHNASAIILPSAANITTAVGDRAIFVADTTTIWNCIQYTKASGEPITSSSGGITWNEVTGTSQGASVDNGYICNNAALVTVTLPDTAVVGSVVRLGGKGAGGWKLAQNASENIRFGNTITSTGTGGYLSSTDDYDAIEVLCVTANTNWVVVSSIGNITVV